MNSTTLAALAREAARRDALVFGDATLLANDAFRALAEPGPLGEAPILKPEDYKDFVEEYIAYRKSGEPMRLVGKPTRAMR